MTIHIRGNGEMPHEQTMVAPGMTLEDLRDIVAPIAERYGIKRVRLFGSRSRGDFDDDSDFDLLISVKQGTSLMDLGCFVYDLEHTLGKSIGVSFEGSSSRMFLNEIAPELKEVYA